MKCKCFFILSFLFFWCFIVSAQTGPWAKYDGKMKGEALIRESDGGNLKEVQSIVEGGSDVNWQLELTGLTPLMAAASAGKIEVVKFLLSKGADPNIKDNNGRTALDRARLAGASDVAALLKGLHKPPTPPTPTPVKKTLGKLPVLPPAPPLKDTIKITKAKKTITQSWAPFGSYAVGQKVRFFIGGWKEGTIIEVGTPGNYAAKSIVPSERKYLIAREGAPNWNESMDWGKVTGLKRENYWTEFFIGDWKLGETMSVNTRTDGVYERDEYSFHAAKEALSVNEDKTYRWKTADGKVITGKWSAAEDGAGIVLLKGFQGLNWTLRNETNAAEENIRHLQSARLTTNGKMSITAKRPL
ncbi:MAG: Ankyrin repeat-containing protein [Flaviaesturariibacter sp.]|nr:Ankyrin repeat-containing protein [Flaviaesturariibacter sp.]